MSEMISFHCEDVALPNFIHEDKTSAWIEKIAHHHSKKIGFINFIFCSDEYLLNINQQYLGHDYYTDIITFPYKQDEILEADIYISTERVQDNAQEFSVSYENEMARVMSHGLLHLMGFGDKEVEAERRMRMAEDEAMALR